MLREPPPCVRPRRKVFVHPLREFVGTNSLREPPPCVRPGRTASVNSVNFPTAPKTLPIRFVTHTQYECFRSLCMYNFWEFWYYNGSPQIRTKNVRPYTCRDGCTSGYAFTYLAGFGGGFTLALALWRRLYSSLGFALALKSALWRWLYFDVGFLALAFWRWLFGSLGRCWRWRGAPGSHRWRVGMRLWRGGQLCCVGRPSVLASRNRFLAVA